MVYKIEDTNDEPKLLVEEVTIKTRMNKIKNYLGEINKIALWECVAKYLIPIIGIMFFIVYFIVGFFKSK